MQTPAVIGTQQSPITLRPEESIYSPVLKTPQFEYLDSVLGCFTQNNNDHDVFWVNKDVRADIKFRGLTARLTQIHMHGESEHQICSALPADGEIHFVHTITTPDHTIEPSTYIVLSAFLQLDSKTEKDGFFRLMRFYRGESDDPNCPPFPAEDLNELQQLTDFYYYRGSLTGPPYSEDVTWIVFNKPILVARDALDLLRPATQHARSVHALNRRLVLRNFEQSCD